MKNKVELQYYCPLLNSQFPQTPCPFALKAIEQLRSKNSVKFSLQTKKIMTDDACEWYVLDKGSCYCWFKFWANPENKREYTLEEIGQLLGLSREQIFFIEEKALKNFKERYLAFSEGQFDKFRQMVEDPILKEIEARIEYYKIDALFVESFCFLSENPRPLQELIAPMPFKRQIQLNFDYN